MGAFKIEIVGVGGHGCDRKTQEGGKLYDRCGRFGCPDCMAHDFVQQLRQRGMLSEGGIATGQELTPLQEAPAGAEIYYTDAKYMLTEGPVPGGKRFWRKFHQATFTHWPDSPTSVVDDLLTNTRKSGHF